MANLTIQQEKFLFKNDLSEYTKSKEGKALAEAFKSNDKNEIEKALLIYYTARETKTFTYNSELERIEAIKEDKMLSELLAQNN